MLSACEQKHMPTLGLSRHLAEFAIVHPVIVSPTRKLPGPRTRNQSTCGKATPISIPEHGDLRFELFAAGTRCKTPASLASLSELR